MTDVTCHIFRLWSIWFVWPVPFKYTISFYFTIIVSLSIVERAKLLGRIAPRRNLERFQTHVCRCCESRRRVRVPRATHESRFYVCTKTNRFDGGLLNLPGVQTIFLISISIDKEWCIFVPIVRQSVTTCSRNDTDVRGNDIPIKVESVERVGRFKSVKSLAVNFDLNAL